MKIKGYKLFLESNQDIKFICRQYDIQNYTINDDGSVDVDGNVRLYGELLTKLPLKFGKVTGYFNCSNNQLISLEGSPHWVGNHFDCDNNKITSLDGSPHWVGGNFDCSRNNLKTLEGGPEVVINGYYCRNNNLNNFKGFPEDFDGYTDFYGNPVYNLLDITEEKWNKFIYWCNEYDAIDDQGKVIPERMEEVYNKLDLVYED